MGRIIFHGIDEEGNKVYTVGRLDLINEDTDKTDKVIFSNTSPTVLLAMTFGGLFSRRLHIDFIAVPLLVKGAQQTYHNILTLVEKTRQKAKTSKIK